MVSDLCDTKAPATLPVLPVNERFLFDADGCEHSVLSHWSRLLALGFHPPEISGIVYHAFTAEIS